MSRKEEVPGTQSNFGLLLLPLRSTKASQEACHLCFSARMQAEGREGRKGRGRGDGERVHHLETVTNAQGVGPTGPMSQQVL